MKEEEQKLKSFTVALGFFNIITKNTFIAVLITWLVFSGLYTGMAILLPIWISVLLGLCSGLITYLFFLRYDVMTVFFGVFINAFLPGLFLYLHQPNTSYLLTGVAGIILLTALFGYGLLARLRGVPLNDMAVEPAYARNITERQRMKLELDVARQAQRLSRERQSRLGVVYRRRRLGGRQRQARPRPTQPGRAAPARQGAQRRESPHR